MMRRSSVHIVRTWIETLGDSSVELRGMVRNVQSGETKYFRDWEALVAFVKDHTDDPHELTDEPLSNRPNDPPNNPGDDAERSICPPASTLATARAFMQTSNMPGRVLVAARGNHFLVSSAPPLGHTSEEINPVEAMLAALGTCGIFIHESAAIEQGIQLNHASAIVQADWDVCGLRGEDFSPHMQAIRVHWQLGGVDEAQAEMLVDTWLARCPIYNTLIEATDITVTHEVVEGAITMPQ